MRSNPYPSDLSEAQWELIKSSFPKAKPGGRPRTVDLREIVNAIFYLNKTGSPWRHMPRDFPLYVTVHYYYRQWRLNGTWKKIHEKLRTQVRHEAGRKASPSAGVIDSQSVKTTEKGGCPVTTRARKSKGAKGTSSSTRWG